MPDHTSKYDHLTEEQRHILFENGTERPFSGDFLYNKEEGMYTCAACGSALFSSEHKYDSQSGWPSFFDVVESDAVVTEKDTSLGMVRIEVRCANCNGHLGHLFEDGPWDKTGKRYCINSAALSFDEK